MAKLMFMLYMEAWKRDLKAIIEGFSEEVTFKLDLEGWGGVHQLDSIERAVQGKAEVNEYMTEWINEKDNMKRYFKEKHAW